ncbi:kinase-like domain-containing protein [Rhodocollybia butyracea]|uniref:non-specific serine/threonine protein kinase n=1 Tax=Rhodocollybia butyracea TaxID=206335 RepID=A0A9P5QAN8_9AGAR|nr:kinase-like domain-containing protein [Rhodocollybia butyracea]
MWRALSLFKGPVRQMRSVSTNSSLSKLSVAIRRTGSSDSSEHHAAVAGELYNGRYRVLKKLGQGTRSTVWLVQDELNERLAAMKVLISEDNGLDEARALRTLRSSDNNASGYGYICHLIDDFTHLGTNKNHLCIVLEPMGVSLLDVYTSLPQAFPLTLLKKLCVHILSALQYMHDTCGIIHTDLKPDNVMLTGNTVAMGEDVTLSYSELYNTTFKLGDFGQAVDASSHDHSMLVQPTKMRCPEVILGAEWGTKADIFNFACMIYELARGAFLFDPFWQNEETGMNPPQTHLAQMTGLLGNFPVSLVKRGTKSSRYFDESGHLKKGTGLYDITLEDLLARAMHPEPAEDITALANFLQCGLIIDPEERWSAKRLLGHPWLRSV